VIHIKDFRRLTVYVPKDHWIYDLPRGKRSEVIRNLLDNTGKIMESIDNLEQRLNQRIDQRLSKIEHLLEDGATITAKKEEQKTETTSERPEIDIDAFMDI